MAESKFNALEWVQLNPTGTCPTARSGHSITGMGRMSIMFGGIDPQTKKNGKIFPNNQVIGLILGVHSEGSEGEHRVASHPMRW